MFESITLPTVKYIKPILICLAALLIIGGSTYTCSYLRDHKAKALQNAYTAKIEAQAKVIDAGKTLVASLQAKLAVQVAQIPVAKVQAQSATAKAKQTVQEIEAEAPADAQEPIKNVDAIDQTVIAADEVVITDTQDALTTCQETVQGQSQVIQDQGTQIVTVQADLATQATDLEVQTTRKKRYRTALLVTVGGILVKVLVCLL